MACRHMYPLNVYRCPNGHEEFYSGVYLGAVEWSCPDCRGTGIYVRCEGEGMTWLRKPRPVKGPNYACEAE